MSVAQIAVTLGGLALMAGVAWFFSAQLPEGETVPVDFPPEQPGEYQFSCQMGMVRGRLVVN